MYYMHNNLSEMLTCEIQMNFSMNFQESHDQCHKLVT